MGLRDRAVATLGRIRALDLLLRGRRLWPRRGLVVLNYHRVIDEPTELDDGVVSASSATFAAQVEQVARFAKAITIDDLCAALAGQRALPDNAVLLTFDDGYRDNHDIALPVLRRHGVPATFFVTTGYVGHTVLPWWDRISYVLRRTRQRELVLHYPTELRFALGSDKERSLARRAVLRLVKQVFRLDLPRFLQELETAAAVAVDEARLAAGLFMDWEQVAALQGAGMDIGSHTVSHRVLQTIPQAEALHELTQPREELAQRLGQAPRAIAYPVGIPLSQASGLRDLVAQAGYEVGFTFVPGLITIDAARPPDALNLPRMAVEYADPVGAARFKTALGAPRLLI